MSPPVQEQNLRAAAADMTNTADWYVYYRVRVECAHKLQVRVAAMQNFLLRACTVNGTLKRRRQARDGRHTWMEIYTAVPENFEAILGSAVLAAKLGELIDGERHNEQFWDPESCA